MVVLCCLRLSPCTRRAVVDDDNGRCYVDCTIGAAVCGRAPGQCAVRERRRPRKRWGIARNVSLRRKSQQVLYLDLRALFMYTGLLGWILQQCYLNGIYSTFFVGSSAPHTRDSNKGTKDVVSRTEQYQPGEHSEPRCGKSSCPVQQAEETPILVCVTSCREAEGTAVVAGRPLNYREEGRQHN